MIFLDLSVIILAERFWSIAFLREKMREIKHGKTSRGQVERRKHCEGKIIRKTYLRKMQDY